MNMETTDITVDMLLLSETEFIVPLQYEIAGMNCMKQKTVFRDSD